MRTRSLTHPVTLALIFAGAVATLALAAEMRIQPGTRTLLAPSEVRWEPMPGLPGAQQSPLWGDPKSGEHGILYRWPAGILTPLHTHTHGEQAVVVSGTMTLAVAGAAAKSLPAGAYFSMSGGTRHVTGCTAAADCVFFLHREGPFDANMVEGVAATAALLDGRSFAGRLGEKGKSRGDADSFVFRNGEFRSTACDAYGFGASPYRASRQGGDVTFEATTRSAREGTMEWKGTISGDKVNGTILWTRTGKAPVEYWFSGTAG